MKSELITGNIFPEEVFKKDFNRIISIEFDVLFRETFVHALKVFCQTHSIPGVYIVSLDQIHPFNHYLTLEQLDTEYLVFFKENPVPEQLPNVDDYYTLIYNFVIFSDQPNFALYASRNFDVGVLGFEQEVCIDMFENIALNIPLHQGFKEMRFDPELSQKTSLQFKGKEFFFLSR